MFDWLVQHPVVLAALIAASAAILVNGLIAWIIDRRRLAAHHASATSIEELRKINLEEIEILKIELAQQSAEKIEKLKRTHAED